MEIFRFDNQREIFIGDDEQVAVVFATARFIHLAKKAIQEHKTFSVALSGGTTPKKFYEYLALPENSSRVDWSSVHIFWSDERAVAPDHPESNYGMAMKIWSQSPIAKAHFYRMQGEAADLEKAACDYEAQIKKHCFEGRFDLMLLGIGQDGHTASLFPYSKALEVHDKLIVSTVTSDNKNNRLSVTFPCIHESRQVMVFAFGKNKTAVFRELLYGEEDYRKYPAQCLGQKAGSGPVLFVVDKETASFLIPHNTNNKIEKEYQ